MNKKLAEIIEKLQHEKTKAHNELMDCKLRNSPQENFWAGKVSAYDEAIKLVGNADNGE